MQRILPVDVSASFFEFTVAMAFDHFARQAVDIAVIETGLGGRLDSTNIIDPELSVITNIGWDHMNLLGNSLESIATEKAGIIKKNRPVIIGECLPETLPVFQKMARDLSAPLVLAEESFDLLKLIADKDSISCMFRNRESGENTEVITGSGGLYQANNTRTVLTAVNRLRKQGFFIDDDALRKGLLDFRKITGLRGRWEMIGRAPDIIAEVAHNKDGIRKVLEQLEHQYPEAGYHFVLGFVRDKDIDEILSLFPKNANYYFTNAHIPRALPHEELKEKANSFLPDGPSFDDVNEALAAAQSRAKEADVIMICGSFFILSELKLT